jgi:hypothetical protein
MKNIVILSTSLFTDRILLYSSFYKSIPPSIQCEVWSTSYPNNKEKYENNNIKFRPFPLVSNFRERYNIIREINNIAWAFYLNAPSILSMKRYQSNGFNFRKNFRRFFVNLFSKSLATFRLVGLFENMLFNILKDQPRSSDSYNRLDLVKPDLLVVTNPFWMHESAVAIEAKKLGIPVFSFIPSWDNITTKSRFVFKSDFYAVWSEEQKKQLNNYYPYTKNSQVFVVGAPQYDVFINNSYDTSQLEFFKKNNLVLDLPVILYALGSPNFIKSEFETCRQFLEASLKSGSIEDFQVLIRPHPNKDSNNFIKDLVAIHKNIHVQTTTISGIEVEQRSQTEMDIVDWIETFKFSDVLVNLSSTCIFDAAYFQKPIININFDHSEKGSYDSFIKEINATWLHLRPVFETGALYNVNSIPELSETVKVALKNPLAKLQNQQVMLEKLCNNSSGRSGEALIQSIESSLGLVYSENES